MYELKYAWVVIFLLGLISPLVSCAEQGEEIKLPSCTNGRISGE